jgi:hypothetical protein
VGRPLVTSLIAENAEQISTRPSVLSGSSAFFASGQRLRGRLTEAEPLLHEARETYAALGATAWLTELERQREKAGT